MSIQVTPMDKHNQALVEHVHPSNWVNPQPAERYNLVVIGGGTAGLVTAAGAAGLGAKVALVERNLMGGDCLNVGCVPSKALLAAAHSIADVRRADEFGIHIPCGASVDFAFVMERMRKIRSGISQHDSVERFTNLGVDVFLGDAQFSNSESVIVNGQALKFKKAVICTGARAWIPPIEGLAEAGCLTNETVFSLTELPQRLLVIGGGPIGCELAQAFRRFGSDVHIVEMGSQFLSREDPEAAEVLRKQFEREGIHIHLAAQVKKVIQTGDGKEILFEKDGETEIVTVDEILAGAGRTPNVDGLNLGGVGVEYDAKRGVAINDKFQTTNPKIYAAGDICMDYKFTHAADFAARAVIRNALFRGNAKLSALLFPWCTYTDPEIAHVGIYEREAKEKGIEIDTYTKYFKDIDRALAEGDTNGFVKIHTAKGRDKIIGATIVNRHAGDMIGELVLAMQENIGLGKIANVIHPYPTEAEAIRKLGDDYNRTRLTPFTKRILKWIMSFS